MTPLPLTEAMIRAQTTDKVYARGVAYCEDGAVLSLVRRGRTLYAEVEGSEDEPYRVSVAFPIRGTPTATCTCPYMDEWDGWCKHVVAALLFYLEQPGEAVSRPTVQALLKNLSREELQALVTHLTDNDGALVEEVEAWIQARTRA